MADKDWYAERMEQFKAEQGDKTREEITEDLKQTSEHVFDPATAPKQNHRWIDRGLVLSCEGASHPNHRAWKRQEVPIEQ